MPLDLIKGLYRTLSNIREEECSLLRTIEKEKDENSHNSYMNLLYMNRLI